MVKWRGNLTEEVVVNGEERRELEKRMARFYREESSVHEARVVEGCRRREGVIMSAFVGSDGHAPRLRFFKPGAMKTNASPAESKPGQGYDHRVAYTGRVA
jgi:hypothetical protein